MCLYSRGLHAIARRAQLPQIPIAPCGSSTPCAMGRGLPSSADQRCTGQVVVNLARLVEKKALTLRTLASWVNRLWLMLR